MLLGDQVEAPCLLLASGARNDIDVYVPSEHFVMGSQRRVGKIRSSVELNSEP
jgi:hypothetical protein